MSDRIETKCPKCECVFSYTKDDIVPVKIYEKGPLKLSKVHDTVRCPGCS